MRTYIFPSFDSVGHYCSESPVRGVDHTIQANRRLARTYSFGLKSDKITSLVSTDSKRRFELNWGALALFYISNLIIPDEEVVLTQPFNAKVQSCHCDEGVTSQTIILRLLHFSLKWPLQIILFWMQLGIWFRRHGTLVYKYTIRIFLSKFISQFWCLMRKVNDFPISPEVGVIRNT